MATAFAAVLSVTPVDIAGQTAPAKKPVPALAGGMPRLADGHPDLQGTYDLGTITPLERRAGTPLVLTDEEAQKLEAQVAKNYDKGNAQIAGDRAAPPRAATAHLVRMATSAAITISGWIRDRSTPP
jgi:hypothetical protein